VDREKPDDEDADDEERMMREQVQAGNRCKPSRSAFSECLLGGQVL
jgi:hypothetical protein